MAEWTLPIPDDLDARVRSHVQQQGGDLADFVSRAVAEKLAYESDAALQAELIAKCRRGMADVDAGRVRDAREVMDELADKHGLASPE